MEILCEQGCGSGMDWLYKPEWIVSLSTNPKPLAQLSLELRSSLFLPIYTVVHNELLASYLNSVESRSIELVESVLCHKHLMLCGVVGLHYQLS